MKRAWNTPFTDCLWTTMVFSGSSRLTKDASVILLDLVKIHFILFIRGLLPRRTHDFDRVPLKSSWRKEFPDKRHAISLRDFCCLCSLPGRNGRKSIPSGKTSGEAINIFSNLGNHTNKNQSFLRSSICCQQLTACLGAPSTSCRERNKATSNNLRSAG